LAKRTSERSHRACATTSSEWGGPAVPGGRLDIGGQGNDGFFADDADGADVVDGGPGGFDSMSYSIRTSGRVKVTLDGVANDGDPAANGGGVDANTDVCTCDPNDIMTNIP